MLVFRETQRLLVLLFGILAHLLLHYGPQPSRSAFRLVDSDTVDAAGATPLPFGHKEKIFRRPVYYVDIVFS